MNTFIVNFRINSTQRSARLTLKKCLSVNARGAKCRTRIWRSFGNELRDYERMNAKEMLTYFYNSP